MGEFEQLDDDTWVIFSERGTRLLGRVGASGIVLREQLRSVGDTGDWVNSGLHSILLTRDAQHALISFIWFVEGMPVRNG